VRFDFGSHTPVKFYPDPLTFAGVIREKPILSKCILRCHAYEIVIGSLITITATITTIINQVPQQWRIQKS